MKEYWYFVAFVKTLRAVFKLHHGPIFLEKQFGLIISETLCAVYKHRNVFICFKNIIINFIKTMWHIGNA